MAQAGNQELTERFIEFYQNYYREQIGELAQKYPNERRSLYIDYDDLYQFDHYLADDYLNQPAQIQEYAEEALRLYDLPADVKLGNAHVRIENLPETVDIRDIRPHNNHAGKIIAIDGQVFEASEAEWMLTDSAFECQRCGTMNYIPQQVGEIQEPHDCQGCEREGPFKLNLDQSEFVSHQQIELREHVDSLSDGAAPQSIEVNFEDDLAGEVAAGDDITVVGIVHLRESNTDEPVFDIYLDGISFESRTPDRAAFFDHQSAGINMETYTRLAPVTFAELPDDAREEETKAKLITPFVEALGWDKFDNSEVRLEYSAEMSDKRVDYALFGGGSDTPNVLVEAKQTGSMLQSHIHQICDYLRIFDAEWGVLTNGEQFYIYHNADDVDSPQLISQLTIDDLSGANILESVSRDAFSDE
jgi:hypothetical protein